MRRRACLWCFQCYDRRNSSCEKAKRWIAPSFLKELGLIAYDVEQCGCREVAMSTFAASR